MNKHQFAGKLVALWERWTEDFCVTSEHEWHYWLDELETMLEAHEDEEATYDDN